jgi:hypothetical protein
MDMNNLASFDAELMTIRAQTAKIANNIDSTYRLIDNIASTDSTHRSIRETSIAVTVGCQRAAFDTRNFGPSRHVLSLSFCEALNKHPEIPCAVLAHRYLYGRRNKKR